MELRRTNVEVDKLKDKIPGPPNLDTAVIKLQQKTRNIHIGFIFDGDQKLLQLICLLLSSTPAGKLYKGWQDFGSELGLTREQLLCIEYNFKGLQDPTYYVLLTFAQLSESTFDKLLIACRDIKRFDIINRIIGPLDVFIDKLSIDPHCQGIQRPKILPRVPLVLKPLISENICSTNVPIKKLSSSNITSQKKKVNERSYGSIVMLTFTKDGEDISKNICRIFREQNPKIGVLILQEQEKFVYSRVEEFIDDCFKQVNYIIPILTTGYINHINNLTNTDDKESLFNNLDHKYVKYLYSLMRFEYCKNNCHNDRIRCIVPNENLLDVIKADLHPCLQAWFKYSDIDPFTKNILLKKF
ncbi:uncharacterized protein LOC123262466 [Cotesia glomerata]|uniref:Death domain-containing protein n=1 Tax=Cotesia glomerata TaxID=32391 RepID=A0AAV7IPJ5_COTGL|nr:uncharacterized protein LOC123262466 [Cotesia glomerata]KAH0555568.1 hypothetical protein KQX54_020161 [Cotesia glomerata]